MRNYNVHLLNLAFLIISSALTNSWSQSYDVPLEIEQKKVKFNFSSQAGMPISGILDASSNTKIGSNGLEPTTSHQEDLNLTTDAPSPGNYLGASVFPGGWRTEKFRNQDERANDGVGSLAQGLDWHPKISNGGVTMRWAMIGSPLVSRQTSYLLGDKIEPPNVDEFDIPLTGISPNEYWRAMPHKLFGVISAEVISKGSGYKIDDIIILNATNSQGGDSASFKVTGVDNFGAVNSVKIISSGKYIGDVIGTQTTSKQSGSGDDGLTLKVNVGFTKFYWSSHADAVFATQSGVVPITWIRRQSVTNPNLNNAVYHQKTTGGGYFALLEKTYVVSGASRKKAKTIYWTEQKYTGPLVQIPNSQVNEVKIVFNSNFPERVDPFVDIYNTSIVSDTSQTIQESRTLWYEYGSLHAYNAEGRVFIEYLGSLQENKVDRVHLGFDIIDVKREARPVDMTVDLGDPISSGTNENLTPKPINNANFIKPHLYNFTDLDGVESLYAVRESININDVLVYWLSKGDHGIHWPIIFARYDIKWPLEASKYSHYARSIGSQEEALLSAVKLPTENNPFIQYQSYEALKLARITSDQKFYVHLSAHSEHRSLIRYMRDGKVWFERVYSFLNSWVENPSLSKYAGVSGGEWFLSTNNENKKDKPGYFNVDAVVGERIDPPKKDNEHGVFSDSDYWPGYIHSASGDLYNPNAYIDPVEKGFDSAMEGAIIPVNSTKTKNKLEVWWFRKSEIEGFKPVFWPSVVGMYTIKWPHEISGYKPESTNNAIVLASNNGSGTLNSMEARGNIYYENDYNKPGYNPNEEHALLISGKAYALRDDLNIHRNNQSGYSSSPYVLIEYIDGDGRPNMRAFQVIREQPEYGITFEYEVEAGTMLVPPMPLPLIEKPLVQRNLGGPLLNLNNEISYVARVKSNGKSNSSLSAIDDYLIQLTTDQHHGSLKKYMPISLQSSDSVNSSSWFYIIEAVAKDKWSGFVSDFVPIQTINYEVIEPVAKLEYNLKDVTSFMGLADGDEIVVISSVKEMKWLTHFKSVNLEEKTVELEFQGAGNNLPTEACASGLVLIIVKDNISKDALSNFKIKGEGFPENLLKSNLEDVYSKFTFEDRKGNHWVYRGPHKEYENSWFQVKYYYKTQAGFAFPGIPNPPSVGTITPFLRAEIKDSNNQVNGHKPDSSNMDRAYGDFDNDKIGDGNSLAVTYKPKWPEEAPLLLTAQTLTKPINGLPSVRGQSSLKVLYQQSKTDGKGDEAKSSVILHDPTREKVFYMSEVENDRLLHKIPSSINTEVYRGKTYFPNLPPHLVKRFFFDPNRGSNGGLVFKGEFVDEVIGESYLLLNVVGNNDLLELKNLFDSNDPKEKSKWDSAIQPFFNDDGTISGGLKATLELFQHNNSKPGSYHSLTSNNKDIYINSPVGITSDDQAVDSYALTASGPGIGYITLIAGNGLAFTPPNEPVSLYVVKVVPELYAGEIKSISADNPLSEKMTMQQIVDFAGQPEKFDFEWKISPPDDGKEPQIYEMSSIQLLTDGEWNHVAFPVSSDFNNEGKLKNHDYFGSRSLSEVNTEVEAISDIIFTSVEESDTFPKQLRFYSDQITCNRLKQNVDVIVQLKNGTLINGAVGSVTANSFNVTFLNRPIAFNVESVSESIQTNSPQSIIYRSFTRPKSANYIGFCLSMNIDDHLGAEVYIDGNRVVGKNLIAENTKIQSPPKSVTNPLQYSWLLSSAQLSGGSDLGGAKVHRIVVKLFSSALPNKKQGFNMRLHGVSFDDLVADSKGQWKNLDSNKYLDGVRAVIGGKADVQILSDNWLTMRYRAKNLIEIFNPVKNNDKTISINTLEFDLKADQTLYFDGGKFTLDQDANAGVVSLTGIYNGNNLARGSKGSDFHPESTRWSQWTQPQLSEGWIKRVLRGINPFHQRAKNLFNNRVDTGVSMLTQAGPRWEGDIALNMENINEFGLIEIYETVLNRGKLLSIDSGINYAPANDALLLAAGYVNDLYMFLGNEASADAANPTIGIGTTDGELGSVSTSLFSFKGQVPSLLEEELGLLRGRDDFLQPGVRTAPAYNRFYWNFTRGIDAGEVIYALNYNITEDEDQGFDGLVDAKDAQKMYPQGHGDAYGHYLTALKGYYQLIVDEDFTWEPRTEAVLVQGKPVQIDYLDERKFATAAAAVARTGNQIVELTWRKDYMSENKSGWEHLSSTRYNSGNNTTRHWGVDQWASRTGTGSYLNWVAGNAMLPEDDTNPEHEGIQKIDRHTVPELLELVVIGDDLQVTMDNVESGMNPLGMNENSIALDIDPHFLEAGSGTFTFSHFDQIYTRALVAMNNATSAFDDAKGVTEMLRSEENSLNDFQTEVAGEELAFKHELIELYGTPYSDDIGPGKTYPQGYSGPDLNHFMYVDTPELSVDKWIEPQNDKIFYIDKQVPPWTGLYDNDIANKSFSSKNIIPGQIGSIDDNRKHGDIIKYNLNSHGYFEKPDSFIGKRSSPGQLQAAITEIILATNGLREALENHVALKYQLDREVELLENKVMTHDTVRGIKTGLLAAESAHDLIVVAHEIKKAAQQLIIDEIDVMTERSSGMIPKNWIAGMAAGGDVAAAARTAVQMSGMAMSLTTKAAGFGFDSVMKASEALYKEHQRWTPFMTIAPLEWKQELREAVYGVDMSVGNLQMSVFTINEKLQSLEQASRNYDSLVAQGDRIQARREIFRQRSSAIVQGMRTRDAGFRIIRNEKIERYKNLFDLAARYTYLTAKAYDYDTGLLHGAAGQDFFARIVNSRALGVMSDGEPQFAGSNTGDPGLSSVLSEMKNDYEVLRGRLGLNNPDTQGTTLSLRMENFRILPGADGKREWIDILNESRTDNILNDADVIRHCMQIDSGNKLPVPGLILEFRTMIKDGYNIFGRQLAGGDSQFSPSNYATKIHGVGVGFEGYIGMDEISTNGGSVDWAGGSSPNSPIVPWLDSRSLTKSPHIYLIPVGQDVMRSPPLGDTSVLRSWDVNDVTVPLPFNIGASDFSNRSIWQTSDILSEDFLAIRKHQSFRAVLWNAADGGAFNDTAPIYAPSKIVNNRLIGRSVWNTKWKLVIPGKNLLNDPEEGLNRFIETVNDIKVHFETYSYSGN